jgi:type VI secretion system protein ImpJ
MAGEFVTFTEATRRPQSYPPHRHENFQQSFAPVVADLRRSLSSVMEQTAIAIPLQERRQGVRVGQITDRTILRGSNFVLSVQADIPTETLRREQPAQVKIGAVEPIRELVNVRWLLSLTTNGAAFQAPRRSARRPSPAATPSRRGRMRM